MKKATPFEAVFFDLDDTLYPEVDFVLSGFSAVANYLSSYSSDEYSEETIFKYMVSILNRDGRGAVFNETLMKIGLNVDEWLSTLIYIYRNHIPSGIRLDVGMENLIIHLKKQNCKVGVITDGTFVVQNNKTNVLLNDIEFNCVIHTDSLGANNWKPSKEPFIVASKLVNVEPANAVYIGDNPVKDFKGAKSIGMYTIWWNPDSRAFDFPDEKSTPDLSVNSIQMLHKHLIGSQDDQ